MASPTSTLLEPASLRTRLPLQPSDAAGRIVKASSRFDRSLPSNVTFSATKSSAQAESVYGMSHEGTPYDPSAIVRVLIPISIAGWLLFGVICILCINGRGKLGRWIPEWYLDSEGTGRDKAVVVLWWAAVIALWPAILPVLLVRKTVRTATRWVAESRREVRMLWPRDSMEEV
ncbi:hypothetical protein Trco_005085 [Trichoderma cornu-damae]|uniref:Uncharacterized protein n=1 Tax=Trichoderma cornu-damae TaxID=654480 RepID=A0A9P8TVE0_9HYPO|nr:hypothetical protein Trco_005085 [Trichoderma cornu-damae]